MEEGVTWSKAEKGMNVSSNGAAWIGSGEGKKWSDADAIETHAECFNRRSVSLKYALYNAIEGKEWNDCESEFSLRRTRVGGEGGGGGGGEGGVGERRRRKRRRKRRREGCWRWLALVLLVFHWDLEIKYLHESSFASVYTAKLASPKYSAFTRLVECQEGRRARRMRRRRRNIEIEVEVKVEEKVGWRGGGGGGGVYVGGKG
ncbi:hypothetical protein V1477_002823 [Vespula maculifrons]|uniref:Uncharacterized protein n=1 Tax=Vespula maculifrons TaxID=7453 RepID=A0ABD2CUS3_VESMC